MSLSSTIEWTDASWNPTRGCTKISPGCQHCYAAAFAERFRGVANSAYKHGFDARLAPEMLLEPLGWERSRRIFVNSMSDLFHEDFSDDYLVDCAQVMCAANWHTFQVLTKRADRLADLLATRLRFAAERPHIWWGVSTEDRRFGLPRIERLRQAPARMRFLSAEPLLEDLGELELEGIAWVICGGESGRGARPIRRSWVTSIRDQCRAAGVPFFFKQWGGVHKRQTGRLLEGAVYNEFPRYEREPLSSEAERNALVTMIEEKYNLVCRKRSLRTNVRGQLR